MLQVCRTLHHLEPEAVLFGILASCSFITTDCHIRVSGQCGAVAFLFPGESVLAGGLSCLWVGRPKAKSLCSVQAVLAH